MQWQSVELLVLTQSYRCGALSASAYRNQDPEYVCGTPVNAFSHSRYCNLRSVLPLIQTPKIEYGNNNISTATLESQISSQLLPVVILLFCLYFAFNQFPNPPVKPNTMAWMSTGSTNAALIKNLASNGLITSERVKNAMLAVRPILFQSVPQLLPSFYSVLP